MNELITNNDRKQRRIYFKHRNFLMLYSIGRGWRGMASTEVYF